MKSQILGAVIWGLLALGLLTGGGLLIARDRAFHARSLPAEGIVLSTTSTWVKGEQRPEAYIEWKDREQRVHGYTMYGSYTRGDKVTLRYDPNDPEDHRTAGSPAGLVLSVIGLAFLGILVRALIGKKRNATVTG